MSYRRKCLDRKDEECKICGVEEEIEVHHINGNRTDHTINNLMPVCPECHNRIHSGHPEYEEWAEKLPASSRYGQNENLEVSTVRLPQLLFERIEQSEEGVNTSDTIRKLLWEAVDSGSPAKGDLGRPQVGAESALEKQLDRKDDQIEMLIEKL